jgi:hypothetical protein
MSVSGLTTLEGVADFLESDVAGDVSPELRGEVRAAAKLLRTCVVELSMRPREVAAEIDELLTLCGLASPPAADAALVETLRTRARLHGQNLREQEVLRLEVSDLTARTMVRLTEADDPALAAFLICLGYHAARRSAWQSVFPVNPAGQRQ